MSNHPESARLSPDRRRAQIIQIAAAHFSRDGVAGASMSAIARDAGVTRALVYYYFPGKERLLEAVLAREAGRLLGETAPDPAHSPRQNLERALKTYFARFAQSSGGVRELYSPTPAAASAAAGLAAENHAVQLDRLLAATRSEGTEENRLALGAWLAFVEYAARNMADAPGVPEDRLVTLCATALESVLGRPLPEDWPTERADRRSAS
ncbi:TetR/AcrR family transcriptional regulator [Leucobacter weissii]|uniref:TetR/AcrR family transcriptional regulator n=1 Tax=Leucobacter weissii TaxID=1983706 RepID=A0A939MK45_9MICO|nr:TetR/AcrR family transcriptional regulator [Leucobacter weissii]